VHQVGKKKDYHHSTTLKQVVVFQLFCHTVTVKYSYDAGTKTHNPGNDTSLQNPMESAYLFACLLTSMSRVLLEQLTGSQVGKRLPEFYGHRKFITEFTSDPHLSLPEPDQSSPYHPHSTLHIWDVKRFIGIMCALKGNSLWHQLSTREKWSVKRKYEPVFLFKYKNETHYFSRMNMKCHFPLSEHNEFCILFLK